jgi:hypothetical protein
MRLRLSDKIEESDIDQFFIVYWNWLNYFWVRKEFVRNCDNFGWE